MLASGKLALDALPISVSTQDCVIGIEYSGRNSQRRKVMGIVFSKGFATSVEPDPIFQWEVPEKWTLAQAATIPLAYVTSYYALIVRGKMLPGRSILIHCGCGGVGLASISIALHAGCKVFTTVGSQEKKDFLKQKFPELSDRDIGHSRDTSFEQMIMNETDGRGVDFVLNSLSKEKLQAGVRCLAPGGQFLEIGKYDLSCNLPLGMSFFLRNTGFHGIVVDALFFAEPSEKIEVSKLLQEGINNGDVQTLPVTIYSESQIEEAFRFMATGKHIGKILVKIREEEKEPIASPPRKIVPAIPRTYFYGDKSYLVVGGLGGFGIELVNWMITRGAENFVLSSRSKARKGYQSFCLNRWRETKINIVVSSLDASTVEGAEHLIKEANSLAPVGGIFNLAGVLHDALIENLDEEKFEQSLRPKVNVTKNLDLTSRKNCLKLDFFVVFSSFSSGRGNVGQSNYGMGNSAMERIIEKRHECGLPGLAIQWSYVKDVGMATGTTASFFEILCCLTVKYDLNYNLIFNMQQIFFFQKKLLRERNITV